MQRKQLLLALALTAATSLAFAADSFQVTIKSGHFGGGSTSNTNITYGSAGSSSSGVANSGAGTMGFGNAMSSSSAGGGSSSTTSVNVSNPAEPVSNSVSGGGSHTNSTAGSNFGGFTFGTASAGYDAGGIGGFKTIDKINTYGGGWSSKTVDCGGFNLVCGGMSLLP